MPTYNQRLTANNQKIDDIIEIAEDLPDKLVNIVDGEVSGTTLILNSGTDLPYIPLEYIESTGTQYIDSGFIPDIYSRLEMTLKLMDIVSHDPEYGTGEGAKIFGIASIGDGSTEESGWSRIVAGTGTNPVRFYAGLGRYNYTQSVSSENILLNKMTVFVDLNNNTYGYDNTVYTGTSANQFHNTRQVSAYIFARRGQTTNYTPKPECRSSMLLYDFKCYSGNVVYRHFIPCKLKNTNEVGLWELNTDTFYGNDGTGSFIAGPEIS